jgi:hypothetical protein
MAEDGKDKDKKDQDPMNVDNSGLTTEPLDVKGQLEYEKSLDDKEGEQE